MSRPAYLKALGANDLEIICMIFRDFESGLDWLRHNTPFVWTTKLIANAGGFESRYATHKGDIDENIHAGVLNKIFIRWYFGCGEAYALQLVELDTYNTPLVAWDLD
jgi:hypothetical protein